MNDRPHAELYDDVTAASQGHVPADGRTIAETVDALIETLRRSGASEVARYLRAHVEYARRLHGFGRPVGCAMPPGQVLHVVTFDPMVRP